MRVFGLYSDQPGDRPYVHRAHWVGDLVSLAVFWAFQVAGWALVVSMFGWRVESALAVALVWCVFWAVYCAGDSVQAWVWRKVRGRAGGPVAGSVPSGDSGG